DCFYVYPTISTVYPTISTQPTINATLRIDPEEREAATVQVARFSQDCRVYAPIIGKSPSGEVACPAITRPEVPRSPSPTGVCFLPGTPISPTTTTAAAWCSSGTPRAPASCSS